MDRMTQLDRIERLLQTVSDRQDSIENLLAALCAKADFEVDALAEIAAMMQDGPKPLEGINSEYNMIEA